MMTELRSLPYWRQSQFRAAISAKNSAAVARVIHIAVKCKALHIKALRFRFTVTTIFSTQDVFTAEGSHAISEQSISGQPQCRRPSYLSQMGTGAVRLLFGCNHHRANRLIRESACG
jgi:hypothetical protein